MAKRSDFAQKLLDDLRVRKERMAAPAGSSNHSNARAIDANAYSKQTYRGTKDSRTHGTTSSRTGNSQSRSTGSSRTPIRQEASNQMVAYGRGGSSGQMADLSMVLAFALENGATKLTRTSSSSKSSIMGFLNQIGRGSMSIHKRERKGNVNMYWGSSSQFPNISNFHIEEISRGAQKLNQILRACSNGVNVDNFSIEIGKELFKGAMDLEESLRMLVNLQEASEYMTRSQRKSRITLLDEDEDDEDNKIEEQKQIDLPTFSFDKSTRHARRIQEVGRMALKPKMATLTYPTGGSMDESQGRAMATAVSRRHSVSYIPDVKNPSKSSDQKLAKPEKDRIPNVIAKLMGLEELPKNENLKSTTTQKDNFPNKTRERGTGMRNMVQESSRIAGVKIKDCENLVSTSKQKAVEGNKNLLVQKNTSFLLQAEQVLPANNVCLEMVILDGKQPSKDLMGMKPVTRSGKTTSIKTDKQQSAQLKQNSSKDNRERERKQDNISSGEQKLQVRKQGTELTSKSISNKVPKQPHASQTRVNRNSMMDAVNTMHPRGVPNGTYHENLVRRKSSAEMNIHMNDSSQKVSDQENLGIPPAMKEKGVHHVAALQKAKTRRVNNKEIPRRMDEVVTRRNGTLNKLTRPPKKSILDQVTQRTHDKVGGHNGAEKGRASRSKQEEPLIVKSDTSTESIRPRHLVQNLQKEAEAPTSSDHKEDEFQSVQEPKTLVPHDSCQNSVSVSVVPNENQQGQAPIFGADECITSPNALNETQSTHKDTFEVSPTVPLEQQKPINWRKQEPLTESETHLKQIVIKSQLFLNTAEALFRLEIPFGILDASTRSSNHDHDYNCDIKLTLDCSYEIMKRKGKRQELAVHPSFVKVSISFTEVRSLDELVRELSKDTDELKLYGKNGKLECGVEEYVPRMLELDVNNRVPDLNCMWDLGWDVNVFGFVEVDEVVRDLERLVFSGLIDELTRDLFHL